MSNDLNMCQFIGRLGNDPDIRYMPSGSAVANFSIACGQEWKDKNTGEKHEKTEWVRCAAFGRLAEIIGEYLKKGSQVYVSGRMQTRKWEKEGRDQYTTEVIVDRLQMLAKSGGAGGGGNPERPQGQRQSAPPPDPEFDDDIPF